MCGRAMPPCEHVCVCTRACTHVLLARALSLEKCEVTT